MRARLVVGSSTLARELIGRLSDGHRPLIVCSDDERFLEIVSDVGPSATVRHGDPTDRHVLETIDAGICSVLALDSDPERTVETLRAVGGVFPEAFRLGYVGEKPTDAQRETVEAHADRVIDRATVATEVITNRLSEVGDRLRALQRTLKSIDGTLAVVMHDNPDPDAIASAIALCRLANLAGLPAEACYSGDISHQENRAFVNLLDIELTRIEPGQDLSEYGGFALVDHSRPGVNNQLPEATPIDIVIDHHPPRSPVDSRYVDLRSEVGATSTLLVEYLQQSAVQIDETVATALLFGIRVDTDEFRREVCPADFEAAAALLPAADLGTIERIDSPSMSPETLETIALAIRNRSRYESAVVSGVGRLHNRDALAQSADRLLNIEGVTTTLVYGIDDGTIYVSARARGADLDLGEALRDAFGQIGSAGGHADMAGAQIAVGGLENDEKPLTEVVEKLLTGRFLDVLEERWNRSIRPAVAEEYHVDESPRGSGVEVYPPDFESFED